MSNCDKYIIEAYTDNRVNEFLSKLKPDYLRDDLKQELAVILLGYECDRLIEMSQNEKLSAFATKILWNLITQTKNNFFETYRKRFIFELHDNDIDNSIEYVNELAEIAENEFEKKKYLSVHDLHEYYIFQKYTELRNQSDVARYFDVPQKHICNVVNKVKSELKSKIKQCI